MTPAETAAFLRQFNEWRRGDEDIPQPDPRVIGEAIDAAVEMIDRLEAAEKERDDLRESEKWYRRRCDLLQEQQSKMRDPERTIVCDILANGELMHPTVSGDRYAIKDAMEESK